MWNLLINFEDLFLFSLASDFSVFPQSNSGTPKWKRNWTKSAIKSLFKTTNNAILQWLGNTDKGYIYSAYLRKGVTTAVSVGWWGWRCWCCCLLTRDRYSLAFTISVGFIGQVGHWLPCSCPIFLYFSTACLPIHVWHVAIINVINLSSVFCLVWSTVLRENSSF